MAEGRSLVLCVLTWLVLSVPAVAADGDLDTSFSSDGKTTFSWVEEGDAFAVAGLPDGSLLVGGSAYGVAAGLRMALVKLLPNGSPDASFGGGAVVEIAEPGAVSEIDRIHVLDDGRIMLLGTTSNTESVQSFTFVRLLANGDRDDTFGPNGVRLVGWPPLGIHTVKETRWAIAPSGGYFAVSQCRDCVSDRASVAVVRFTPDGERHPNFGDQGGVVFEAVAGLEHRALQIDADAAGRAVVSGNLVDNPGGREHFVARLTATGALDPAFGGGDGLTLTDLPAYVYPYDLVIEPVAGGTLLAIGNFTIEPRTTGVMRIDSEGEVDTSFGFLGATPLTLEEGAQLYAIDLQSDGKIVTAGWIDHTGDERGGFFLARLLPDGQLDATFDGNGVARYEFNLVPNATDSARDVTLSGGKLVAAGSAEGSESSFAILRTQSELVFTDGFERGSTAGWGGS